SRFGLTMWSSRPSTSVPSSPSRNREGLRRLLGTGWLGATKEHSRQGSVTEEQQRQRVLSNRPFGLPFFTATASLLVGQRSLRIFSLLAPRGGGKSQATQPLPIYEMGMGSSTI